MPTPARTAAEIRSAYIRFFEEKCGHTMVPSSPAIPFDDPTLLFANAGMNQFKDVFLGRGTRTYTRAVNTQKCIRAGGKHNDLEDVGRDTYHHTFFEMLGNWSLGDYFKKEAIEWAFELLTRVYGIDPNRLYATWCAGDPKQGVEPDHESRDLWLRLLPADHVIPGSMKDNFWEMGETGPCGPCTEIHFDRIGGRNAAEKVNTGDPDVLEIWNLVFIQFNREPGGRLTQLPAKHVDTGMGLERLVSVLQDKRSNYDTDVFGPIFELTQKVTGTRPYRGMLEDPVDVAYRVIADHVRCLSIAVADGAAPGNEGRNYVLRRILRRAIRAGHQHLGAREPFIYKLVPAVVTTLGDTFPTLVQNAARVVHAIREEEIAFGKTLERGIALFDEAAKRAGAAKRISAQDAFSLHDTFGFPIDLTQVMAQERGMAVDAEGYEKLMEAARERSREGGSKGDGFRLPPPDVLEKLRTALHVHPTDDSGRDDPKPTNADVAAIWDGNQLVNKAVEEQRVALVFRKTPFYAEAGGQVGDTGLIELQGGAVRTHRFKVEDTQRAGEFVMHVGRLEHGNVSVGEHATLTVERSRRERVAANHTGTHLMNHALREVLGGEVEQRGSLVADDRLRFDFTHPKAMTPDELAKVEVMVNAAIARKAVVDTATVPLAQAKAINGVRAVFGERYPDPVRVVAVGATVQEMLADPSNARWRGCSVEFCGGTHAKGGGDVQHFAVLSEGASSAGIRRIFAVTGTAAQAAAGAAAKLEERLAKAKRMMGEGLASEVASIAQALTEIPVSVTFRHRMEPALAALRDQVKEWRKAQEGANRDAVVSQAREIAERATGAAIVETVEGADPAALLSALSAVRAKRPDSAILLMSADEDAGKVSIAADVPKALQDKGLRAGDWARAAAEACGGKGGGRPDFAQAGGKEPARLPEALRAAKAFAGARLGD
ncbi:MAG: alanine--tRNA ligase [Planctomycetes bacterium]|nr:alanine--tRNA ligase [Planctomycetota bacterium]